MPKPSLTAPEKIRLKSLASKRCTNVLLNEIYGVDPVEDHRIWRRYQSWIDRVEARVLVGPEDPTSVNRSWWEVFLQRESLVPIKMAAAKLGMESASLRNLCFELSSRGIAADLDNERFHCVFSDEFLRKMPTYFKSLRDRIFGDHDDFCLRMHEAVKSELKVSIRPLRCATASLLGQSYHASEIDRVSLEPMSMIYRVEIDTKKPMSLAPDACSLSTYVRGERHLRDMLLFETEPYQFQKGSSDLKNRIIEGLS